MKPTRRGVIAVTAIIGLYLLMGAIEARPDTVVVIPTTSDNDGHTDSSTVFVPNGSGGSTIIHCLSSETGLVYCMEL